MESSPSSLFLPLLLSAAVFSFSIAGCWATTFALDIHHRFSVPVRSWAASTGRDLPGGWPEKGSAEYYAALAGHDLGRSLAAGSGVAYKEDLTFSEGNFTLRFNSLGFLHYALVTIGTPRSTYLVALDTGSDLFWVPCECSSCAQFVATGNGNNAETTIYNPNMSSTCERLSCESSFCELQNQCSGSTSLCPYKVSYASADTSSSGILVEDILYLTTEGSHPEVVEAKILFGCGQVQTGSFLNTAAPNGLFGLGMAKISVPSILSSRGLIRNSFSMCFGHDGVGRIRFGDKGSSDQQETPFSLNQFHNSYGITITGGVVGNSLFTGEFSAIVDSGTSFAYISDPAYTFLSQSVSSLAEIFGYRLKHCLFLNFCIPFLKFNAQVQDKRYGLDPKIPFEYCYEMSSNGNKSPIPTVSLTTNGGSQFPITDPVIVISDQQRDLYCLGVIKSNKLNIFGQNFLTGLKIVFDRERDILGWKEFNCYNVEDSNPFPVNPTNPHDQPPVGTNSYTPEAAKQTGDGNQITMVSPLIDSSRVNSTPAIKLLFLVLLAVLCAS